MYRTLSALCASAAQDDVITRSLCRSKKHRPRRQKSVMIVLERGTNVRLQATMARSPFD